MGGQGAGAGVLWSLMLYSNTTCPSSSFAATKIHTVNCKYCALAELLMLMLVDGLCVLSQMIDSPN